MKAIGGLISIAAFISFCVYGYNTWINPTLDGHEVSHAIESSMKKGITASVECPDHPSSRSGNQFTCYATVVKGAGILDGTVVDVLVVVHDNDYQWHVDSASIF